MKDDGRLVSIHWKRDRTTVEHMITMYVDEFLVCQHKKKLQHYFHPSIDFLNDNFSSRKTGKQAVLVLSCDNPHMTDDVMVEPGLVMIFAHGVE